MSQRGFSFLEVILSIALVGLVGSALLMALSQGLRTRRLTHEWAQEENLATQLLLDRLERWKQLRTDMARRACLVQRGEDRELGSWEWRADPHGSTQGRAVDLYRVRLKWNTRGGVREVETDAVLRIVP